MKYEDLPPLSDDNRRALEATFSGLISTTRSLSFKKIIAYIESIPLICRLHHVSLENKRQKFSDPKKQHPFKPLRGEIYNAHITEGIGSELSGNHPVVIVSNPKGNIFAEKVNVLPIEGDGNKINPNYQVQVMNDSLVDGLLSKNPSRVIVTDIMTIDKARVDRRIGKLKPEKMKEIDDLLKKHLNLS